MCNVLAMKRPAHLKALYAILLATILVALVLEAVLGDAWRVFCLAGALVCLWMVRDDLTRSEQ